MLLKELIDKGTSAISSLYPEREAKEMVYAFLESLLGTMRHTHIIEPGYTVAPEMADKALVAFRRMAAGEPLQYVVGRAYFYGREFKVSPDVLIPRPETELLCREAVCFLSGCGRPFSGLRVLDLCTGSGCIAWTIALECPGVEVIAVDLSEGALDTAASQDFSEEISEKGAVKPRFIKADVLAGPLENLGTFDLLVSNPPYVMESEKALMRSNVLDHEPAMALFVSDEDPLVFYRSIALWATSLLDERGLGIVEINEALAPATASTLTTSSSATTHSAPVVSSLPAAASFSDSTPAVHDPAFMPASDMAPRVVRDLNGRDRFIIFRKPF